LMGFLVWELTYLVNEGEEREIRGEGVALGVGFCANVDLRRLMVGLERER